MTTLLIADDQALVRVGLRKILENEPQTTVVGEAGDGQDAVAAARRLRPDVVLMDIRMPVLDGIEATRRIVRAQPSTRVLILTTFGLDDYVYDALRAGASGFMLKDAPPEEIAAAVRIVASGDALLAPAVTRAVIEEFTRIPVRAQPAVPPAVGELTPREREVLDLLIRGLSNPEICRELVVSEATAKTHVAKILQKLGVRDRVQAVIYAYETGLISPSPLSRVKPLHGSTRTISITIRAARESAEGHETPDPVRSNALESRFDGVRRGAQDRSAITAGQQRIRRVRCI